MYNIVYNFKFYIIMIFILKRERVIMDFNIDEVIILKTLKCYELLMDTKQPNFVSDRLLDNK
jgi:hypothetical protein